VNNQFFVNIIRPTNDVSNAWIGGKSIQIQGNEGEEIEGVSGTMSFPVGILRSQESKEFVFHVYAGPKDYAGLASLGHEQKKVMQFGVFWWISEPFSWVLNKLHGVCGSYGLAIIVLTILVKLILWPLTAQATRSQKKMQSLQGPMSKLREKHKGNSQKLNQEMMKFYKEHKVNPFAGCWPILIQIPVFLGMFWMLRSAAELYGQSFLWANDLSEQDHVAQVQGFSLNVLPILMVITQWFQMKLNPMQMGPELSDAQRINAKMMRFMPFMFLIFLYFFSSALVLYWTIQNLMTILQTLITKKVPEPTAVVESLDDSTKEIAENSRTRDEVTDKEKSYRNLLGLKSRGSIDPKNLERNYKERADNYSESRLEEMSASKRRIALDKKQRLEQAHQFLFDLVNK
jgi:YidC/Oxa1 family membrane protein insertase